MTIRRHVDLAAINNDYTAFLTAAEQAASDAAAPHPTAVKIMEIIGDAVDDIIRDARTYGIQTCKGDAIREIEALMFEMLRGKNPEPITALLKQFGDKEHIEAESVSEITETPADNARPSIKDDDEYLAAGTGPLWEVRVTNSLDDIDYCDFHVRAETPGEAADKAETVARRNSDFYFGGAAEPSYHAERQNIHMLEDEEDGEPDLNDDAERFGGYED